MQVIALLLCRVVYRVAFKTGRDKTKKDVTESSRLEKRRRRADSNRWCSFCRAVPYHLATSPSTWERETGIEPATFSLARRCSTTEPLPLTVTLACLSFASIRYHTCGDLSTGFSPGFR